MSRVPARRAVLAVLAALVLQPWPAVGQGRGLPSWVESSWWARRQIDDGWALTDVNQVDVRTGRIERGVHITVRGDRIENVSSTPPRSGVRRVDGEGGYVIPGLFDLHAHVLPEGGRSRAPPPEETLARLLEAGVTTIRLLPLYSESAVLLAARVSHGELAGPTIVPASQVFEKEPQRTTAGFGDPQTAAEWARREALLGSRWIKIYNRMDSASLAAIVKVADRHGLRVGGHAVAVPPAQASRLGVSSIEHHGDMATSCLARGAGEAPAGLLARAAWGWTHADQERCRALVSDLTRRGTAWVPTLVVAERILERGGHERRDFADQDERTAFRESVRRAAELAVHMHRIGGKVGLGTDTPIDGVEPGGSAHRELELLVELGGATNAEALQIGTLGSARVLGFEDLLGTVEPGKLAHLVVLGADPLDDISAVRDVRMVVHGGRARTPRGSSPRIEKGAAPSAGSAAFAGSARVEPASTCPSEAHATVADRMTEVGFGSHRFVFFGSTHGGLKRHEFLLCLLSRPRFRAAVTDILVEFISGAHQRLLDRYLIELEELPADSLRPLAFDTDRPELFATIPQVPGFLQAVRAVNQELPLAERIRVLGGSETIDWSQVTAPEDLAPYPFKTNWSAHLIVEHLASHPDRRTLVVYGDGGHIHHGGTLTGDVEAHIEPDSLFVIGTIRRLAQGDRPLVAPFGDPDRPFFVHENDFPDVDRFPDDLFYAEPGRLHEKIDALVYLGPSSDTDMIGTLPLSATERGELERRERLKRGGTLEVRYGGRQRWFEAHPRDLPPDPRRRNPGRPD